MAAVAVVGMIVAAVMMVMAVVIVMPVAIAMVVVMLMVVIAVIMVVVMVVMVMVVLIVMVVMVMVMIVVIVVMVVVVMVIVIMIVVVGVSVAVGMLQPSMGMAVGMPVLALLLLAVYGNFHPRAGDPAAFRGEPPRAHPGDAQGVQLCGEPLRVRQQTGQRGHQHVPRGAHAALKIQRFHLIPSMRLIMLAKYPAPKPLSIFTTLTPLAQEFSMDSSAESPPKLAP